MVEFREEGVEAFFRVLDCAAFESEAHDVDGRKRQVSATDRRLFAVAVFEHACATAHCSHFVKVAVGVVGLPLLVLVECCVEVDKVGEESAGGYLAGKFIEVVVAVFRQIVDAAFFLPYLYGEYCCSAIANAFVSGVEQFAHNASTFSRRVGAIVD